MKQPVDIHMQNGAALITCLMLLVVMTLLGVHSITSTTMEERMAGNTRNKHLSFQAAEAAIRVAELYTENIIDGDTVFAGTAGLYPRSNAGDADYPIWENVDWTPGSADILDGGAVAGVPTNPGYIVEDYTTAPRDSDCILEIPVPPGCMLPVYRITARGTGLTDTGVTIIQTTYKKL